MWRYCSCWSCLPCVVSVVRIGAVMQERRHFRVIYAALGLGVVGLIAASLIWGLLSDWAVLAGVVLLLLGMIPLTSRAVAAGHRHD